MKRICILLGIVAICAMVFSQEAKDKPKPRTRPIRATHMLEMLVDDVNEPVSTEVELAKRGDASVMKVILPDGERLVTEYIVTEQGHIKFQWAQIKREKVVVVQFVGADKTTDTYKGRFVGMVDGKVNEQMVGDFTLKEKSKK